MAVEKQATTMADQTILYVFDLPLEIWTSPWIVEFSRNSQNMFDAILTVIYQFACDPFCFGDGFYGHILHVT